MAGGLIQLMSYGYADKILISDPEITFFKIVYYKHSLFSIQDHEINSETDINFNSSTFYKINNYGDLFFKPMLQVELPSVQVEYNETIDSFFQKYSLIQKITNLDINFIISNLDSILYNYNPIKFPVYIKDNLIINTYYDNINSSTKKTTFNNVYDEEYNSLFDISTNTNNYEKYIYNLALHSNPTNQNDRNIYNSSFNINYLTSFLNYFKIIYLII